MDIAKAIGREEPEMVFHYTTSNGFLGITDSKSVWATNIHYLNDHKEFNHSFELFRTELYQRKQQDPQKAHIYDFLANSFNMIKELKLFVCSFTEEGDLLSQWRGYCPDGGGLSLGFDFGHIKECAKSQGYWIGPCLYDSSEKKSVVTKILESTIPTVESMFGNTPEHQIRGYFYENTIMVAPFIKHPSFKEEKEWRCSLFPSVEQLNQIKHRAGASLIIPYHEFSLLNGGDFTVKQIIVGPTEHKNLQSNAVSDILRIKGIKWSQLGYSTIPYRVL